MTINIKDEGTQVVAELEGRLDTIASTEKAASFQELAQMAGKTIVFDCGKLEYISSSGLRLLLVVRKAAQAAGGQVIIRKLSDDIRSVFTMTGFIDIFTVE